jgi:ABC-type uncharacterized transport system permease subunit
MKCSTSECVAILFTAVTTVFFSFLYRTMKHSLIICQVTVNLVDYGVLTVFNINHISFAL